MEKLGDNEAEGCSYKRRERKQRLTRPRLSESCLFIPSVFFTINSQRLSYPGEFSLELLSNCILLSSAWKAPRIGNSAAVVSALEKKKAK